MDRKLMTVNRRLELICNRTYRYNTYNLYIIKTSSKLSYLNVQNGPRNPKFDSSLK